MSIKTQMSVSAAALAALTLLTPMSASAQRNGGGNGGQPGGSYAQSCSDIRIDSGRLYAECRTGGRDSRSTSIEYGRCVGDIGNNQGMLVCNGAQGRFENNGGGNGNGGHPGNGNGGGGRPGNDNGNGNGGGWGGGNGPGHGNGGGNGGGWNGRNSITVYEDSNFRGGSTTFNGEMPNLGRRQLNDNISSMQMSGSWEACSDPYFRGACQTFTGDVRNLNSTAINDRISSLRPIRGW